MQLGVGEHVRGLERGPVDLLRVEPEVDHRLAHRDVLVVLLVEQGLVEGAGNRARAEQGGAKAHAFFIREAEDDQRERQPLAAAVQGAHAFDRGDHALHAVVLPAVAHGVQVRAHQQARQPRLIAFVTADDVADRIQITGVHAGLAHPAEHQLVGLRLLLAQEHPGQGALVFGQPSQYLALVVNALPGGHDGLVHGVSSAISISRIDSERDA